MKKGIFLISFLMIGLSTQSYAAKGYANDGLAFMMVVAGALLLLAGLFSTIDFLKRRGRILVRYTRIRVRKAFAIIIGYLHRRMAGNFGLPFSSASS
ncbi:MAG: hypothetical protein EOM90_01475 [Alphaproteobacteria bacterium]|nr:hypothetical protein [Alphaproteobacteria bacterium]